ncbi:hypothetical protein [Iningainema tapete]|uniref:Uncharacterized protein n=1 Tax=Iningainema tapete BLCC-T55 TaxID=2748662 RepID=A0A8J6XFQ0_9CYAN|nr:hypothetical protein [Iningainema tapete]MBD2773198.1 hypothetical protein [Iningainema tapete BLCC-T55]
MSTQFFLDETDIDTLINLLLRSQQSRTREALCLSIGIDPKRISFIRDSSDSDFFLLLIRYLNEIGEKEALCKLCCQELFPVFHHGKYASILTEISIKLNCNQKLSQNTNNTQPSLISSIPTSIGNINPFIQLAQNKLVMGSAIFLIGLAGVTLFNQNSKSFNNSHPPEQSVSQNPNVSLTAHNQDMHQQISSLYQEVVRREPTSLEYKYYVDLLKRGEKLNSIRDWITNTSSLLQDGNIISMECQGKELTNFKWLSSRLNNNSVSLASNTDASTKWKVHFIANGVVALENQGIINAPKWLDGLTHNRSVSLAPNTEGNYTGTKWRINIIGDGEVVLDNQGESKWLNGVTHNGSVNLAPNTEEHTGTKWKISKQ